MEMVGVAPNFGAMRTSALILAALCLSTFLALRPSSDPRIASVVIDPKVTPITLHLSLIHI